MNLLSYTVTSFLNSRKPILLYMHIKFSVGQSSKRVEVKSQKILIAWSVCFYGMNAYFDCCIYRARLAQSVEHETVHLRVVGSSPTLGAGNFFFDLFPRTIYL